MKLYEGCTALYLAETIGQYGNLPYHALKLLPSKYETLKDAAQKLMRAGLVKAIKAPHCKILYLTSQGKAAVREKWPDGFYMGPVVYDPNKAVRAALLNEALLFANLAEIKQTFFPLRSPRSYVEEPPCYTMAADVRAYAARTPRGDDNLKYSRLAGILRRERGCSIVYHFGHCNRVLNPNGEANAEAIVRELCGAGQAVSAAQFQLDRLILANGMNVLGDILRFSLRYAEMPRAKREHIDRSKRPFLVKQGGGEADALFLPVLWDAVPVLRIMQQPGWPVFLTKLASVWKCDGRVVNLLDCRIASWLNALVDSGDSSPRLVLCYHWQRELVNELFAGLAERLTVWVAEVDAFEVANSFLCDAAMQWSDAYQLLPEGVEQGG